jgi:ubiquinone/menaquinone biosynthesis C-methylase UbiE
MTDSVNFNRAADYYDATRGFPPGVDADAVLPFVEAGGLTPRSRVIEIGVGTGRIALPLRAHVGQYAGIDISAAMMDKLRAKPGGDQIDLIEGDARQLPFAAGAFDAVIAVHVFHLIPNARAALDEVRRVTGRNGAPPLLLHGHNGPIYDDELQQVWYEYSGQVPAAQVPGAQHVNDRLEFLTANGWQKHGPELKYSFITHQSPQAYLDSLQARMWSHCWRLTDAQIAHGMEAVRARMHELGLEPNTPRALDRVFYVQAYIPG